MPHFFLNPLLVMGCLTDKKMIGRILARESMEKGVPKIAVERAIMK